MVDERIPYRCETALLGLGYSVIKLHAEKRLSAPVASHTDMLFFRHGNTLITSRNYFSEHADTFKTIESIPDINIIISDEELLSEYPKDRIFNCLAIGNKLFAKPEYLSESISRYSAQRNLKFIPVKQGYPACVTLAAGNLAITSDEGMARKLQSESVRVMMIPNSDKIKLPPYKFGFIGGTAGVHKNTVYFIGNLLSHPCGKEIEAALCCEGYSCVSLDEESDSLFDMGGIFFFEALTKNTADNGISTSPKNPKSV